MFHKEGVRKGRYESLRRARHQTRSAKSSPSSRRATLYRALEVARNRNKVRHLRQIIDARAIFPSTTKRSSPVKKTRKIILTSDACSAPVSSRPCRQNHPVRLLTNPTRPPHVGARTGSPCRRSRSLLLPLPPADVLDRHPHPHHPAQVLYTVHLPPPPTDCSTAELLRRSAGAFDGNLGTSKLNPWPPLYFAALFVY